MAQKWWFMGDGEEGDKILKKHGYRVVGMQSCADGESWQIKFNKSVSSRLKKELSEAGINLF